MNDQTPERALVDTNVLVYAHDPSDTMKHEAARRLLQSLSESGSLAYSAQVLNEFCAVLLRLNREPNLTPSEALNRLLAKVSAVIPS